jgi:hypothetical protein
MIVPEVLTLQERQLLVVAAFLLSAIAELSLPPDLPYLLQVRAAIALAGPLAGIIQKFLAMSPDEQSAIVSVIQDFTQMSAEQQRTFIPLLAQVGPILAALQRPMEATTPTVAASKT